MAVRKLLAHVGPVQLDPVEALLAFAAGTDLCPARGNVAKGRPQRVLAFIVDQPGTRRRPLQTDWSWAFSRRFETFLIEGLDPVGELVDLLPEDVVVIAGDDVHVEPAPCDASPAEIGISEHPDHLTGHEERHFPRVHTGFVGPIRLEELRSLTSRIGCIRARTGPFQFDRDLAGDRAVRRAAVSGPVPGRDRGNRGHVMANPVSVVANGGRHPGTASVAGRSDDGRLAENSKGTRSPRS